MPGTHKKNALERVFEVTNCRTQIELADMLGIKQSSISDAKKKCHSSGMACQIVATKGGKPPVDIDGLGPEKLGPSDDQAATQIVYLTQTKPPEECSAQDLVNELVRRAFVNL